MTRESMYKLTGAALIGSFGFSLAGGVTHPVVDGQAHNVASLLDPLTPWPQLLIYVGALFLMVGLPGLFAWVSDRVGVIGLVGIGGYFLANALSAQAHLVVEAFVAPAIAADPAARHLIAADGTIIDHAPFQGLQLGAGLLFMISLILIGIGVLRSSLPTWIGAVFVVGGILCAVPIPEAEIISGLQVELCRGLGVAALGLLMIRAQRKSAVVGEKELAHA